MVSRYLPLRSFSITFTISSGKDIICTSLRCLYQCISIDIFISICYNSKILEYDNSQELSLLSKTELEWLLGNKQLSSIYNRKIKSKIRKKIENFENFELSLLVEKGLLSLSIVTKFSNCATKYSNTHNQIYSSNDNSSIKYGPDVIRTREPRHVKAVS